VLGKESEPPTLSPAGECVPPFDSEGGTVDTLSRERGGWGVPIQTRGQALVVRGTLGINVLCAHKLHEDTSEHEYNYVGLK
jgi:hypothetical protein